MTREEYITIRNSMSIEVQPFFKYYIREGEKKNFKLVDYSTFIQAFPGYFQMNAGEIFKKFDLEFNVTLLEDTQGQIVRAY